MNIKDFDFSHIVATTKEVCGDVRITPISNQTMAVTGDQFTHYFGLRADGKFVHMDEDGFAELGIWEEGFDPNSLEIPSWAIFDNLEAAASFYRTMCCCLPEAA